MLSCGGRLMGFARLSPGSAHPTLLPDRAPEESRSRPDMNVDWTLDIRTGVAPAISALHWMDLDLAFMLAGLGEVVGHLKPQPCFGITAKRLGKSDRHIERHSALAVYEIVQGLTCHAQGIRRIGDRQPKRLDAVMPRGLAGWGEFFIGMPFPSLRHDLIG
jgi:hypothetical protein